MRLVWYSPQHIVQRTRPRWIFFLHGQEFLSLSLVIPIIIRRTSGSTTRR